METRLYSLYKFTYTVAKAILQFDKEEKMYIIECVSSVKGRESVVMMCFFIVV